MLDGDAELGTDVVTTLHDLRRKGVHIVAATGRRFDSAAPILRRAGLDGWVVVQNGAVVRDLADGRRGRTAYVTSAVGQRLCAAIEAAELDPVVYTDSPRGPTEFWVPAVPRDPTGFLARYLAATDGHHSPVERLSERALEQITRVVCHAPQDRLRTLSEALVGARGEQLRSFEGFDVTQGVHRIEVLSTAADKWQGVRWVSQQLEVADADTVAVGDDANDVEMLRAAGYSFAPSGSHPDALSAAREVLVGAHEPAVVVAALRRHFELDR